jgi:hypothetical protein
MDDKLKEFRAYLQTRKEIKQRNLALRRKARGAQHVNGDRRHSSGDK